MQTTSTVVPRAAKERRRAAVLGALIGAGALSLGLAAQQAPPGTKNVDVVKVRDNLYMLNGGGGTTGVFVQATGVVVIDTKNPGWGEPILDKIKQLTPKPVTMIINTHTHVDHVSGNIAFPATVDVVAQENTAKNMTQMNPVTGLPPRPPEEKNVFADNGGRNLAKRTFKDRMTLGSGADQIDLYYFGRAHTNGDAVVVFPALRVAHFGDLFAFRQPPILDANNGGSGLEYSATLTKAYEGITNVDTIINGHLATTTTWPDLKVYAEYLADFAGYVQGQNKAGKSVEEAATGYKVPERFTGYTAPAARVLPDVQVIYDELKR
jgi:glyoxylase-like metal-dependent hydrolase (beta-lactamase superfamily II)